MGARIVCPYLSTIGQSLPACLPGQPLGRLHPLFQYSTPYGVDVVCLPEALIRYLPR